MFKANNRDIQRVAEYEKLDLVEESVPSGTENQGLGVVKGSASSKTEEKPTSSTSKKEPDIWEHRPFKELWPT
jgi:hypothetical protein